MGNGVWFRSLILKLVAQLELHDARVCQQARVVPEVAVVRERKIKRLHVESRQVEGVEDIPAELQRLGFFPRHLPAFAEPEVQAGKSVPTQLLRFPTCPGKSG